MTTHNGSPRRAAGRLAGRAARAPSCAAPRSASAQQRGGGVAKGFFTDTTLCIGCKACEVACKQWNQLPADEYVLTGMSYDNTAQLGATTWRHVAFVEQFDGDGR